MGTQVGKPGTENPTGHLNVDVGEQPDLVQALEDVFLTLLQSASLEKSWKAFDNHDRTTGNLTLVREGAPSKTDTFDWFRPDEGGARFGLFFFFLA